MGCHVRGGVFCVCKKLNMDGLSNFQKADRWVASAICGVNGASGLVSHVSDRRLVLAIAEETPFAGAASG